MPTTDIEIERLRAEIAQEKQMKDMLHASLQELKLTVDELEKRADLMSDESDEWKTRYETQLEMNEQLEKQALVLHDKIIDAKKGLSESNFQGKGRVGQGAGADGYLPEITPHVVKQLEKEKLSLEGQVRDMEWRLDQESKAYHKAIEERKVYNSQLQAAKGALDHMKAKKASGNQNIPQDQRILDPKKGPIKKTAAVSRLPKLD